MQRGSAQPHVYARDINALNIILPPTNLLVEFEQMAEKYYSNIAALSLQIKLLTESRDRLLPKLMSGEIEV